MPIDWREGRQKVERAVRSGSFGLIIDCDGTISPIALSPEKARVDPRCKAALGKMAQRLGLVAVVSGRPVSGLRHLVGLDHLVYVGNHGLERWERGRVRFADGVERYRASIAQVLAEAEAALAGQALVFEDKGVAAAIHYRAKERPRVARQAILAVAVPLAKEAGLKLIEGKRVVEFRPPLPVDKGTAVERLVADYTLRGGLFLGDDRTDVAALRVMRKLRRAGGEFYAVGVIGDETPPPVPANADFVARGVDGVAALLEFVAAVV